MWKPKIEALSETGAVTSHFFKSLKLKMRKLKLIQFSTREIPSAELSKLKFGFLSARQTATGDNELANESFHLAGGFMAAGLKGVIGTLWSIADEDAPRMAEEVYRAILTKDGMDLEKAAEGLHCAVRKMREDDLPPQRWIPFIHVGI